MSGFTTEQILALAPDAGSAKAGQGLASPGKWVTIECSEAEVWGACQGSGATPYRVMIDLSEPAFNCTCPSRKFPYKHGLGLLLIFANNRAAVKQAAPPAPVAEWLAKRGEKTAKQQKPSEDAPKSVADLVKAAEEQRKRAEQRTKKVTRGLQDLGLWLCDLVRQGISSLGSPPYTFWDEPAGRMVDAQAQGVARMLKEMASIPASGEGWQERLLERIGLLSLLLEAFERIETLPEPVQADVREAIGWNVRHETVLAGEGVPDVWTVVGQRSYDEEQLRVTRTWLHGRDTGRDALHVQFTRPGQPLETLLAAGAALDANLAFFPGAWPLRAIVKERRSSADRPKSAPGAADFADLLGRYSDALALNPWLPTFPAAIDSVVPLVTGDEWSLQDRAGRLMPICRQFESEWKLLGISGGDPIDIFAEWDGDSLFPISVRSAGRLIAL